MKVFNVVHRSRRFDVEVTPFLRASDALDFAKDEVRLTLGGITPKYLNTTLNAFQINQGWIYYCCYNDEGDYLYIQETEIE